MNLTNLSNDELHRNTQWLAEKERLTTIEILWHLREVEKRMLYAEMGYPDLKTYCVKELRYSEGAAWRRISSISALLLDGEYGNYNPLAWCAISGWSSGQRRVGALDVERPRPSRLNNEETP